MAKEIVFYSGPLVTVDFARQNKLRRYFTGRPCKHGHICQRLVANNTCIECLRTKKAKWGCNYPLSPQEKEKRNLRRKNCFAQVKVKERAEWNGEKPRLPRRCSGDGLLRHRAARYGLTLKEVKDLYAEQGGKCWICLGKFPISGKRCLHIDHCHKTHIVRGLLCVVCNRAIGYFRDNPFVLMRAVAYLKTVGHRKPLER